VSVALGLLALQVLGCASTSGIETEMSKLRRDLAQMKKDLQDTQVAVQKLEGQVTLLSLDRHVEQAPPTQVASAQPAATQPTVKSAPKSSAPASSLRAAKADPRAQAQPQTGKVLPVVRLSAKAQQAGVHDDTWVDPGELDDGSPPIEIKLRSEDDGARERIAVDHEVLKHPDPVLSKTPPAKSSAIKPEEATSQQIESEYSQALARLRADNKPEEALSMFETFRTSHPRSNLADNALYWSAECHFQMKAYDRAIAAFEKLVHDRPRSQKVPDALIRSGEAWIALGQSDKAKPILKQVIDSYPKSDAAGRAKTALDGLVQ
jgi:tol-pal system protein YbgF